MMEYKYRLESLEQRLLEHSDASKGAVVCLMAIAERLERLVEAIERRPIHASNTCPHCGEFLGLNTICSCRFSIVAKGNR